MERERGRENRGFFIKISFIHCTYYIVSETFEN